MSVALSWYSFWLTKFSISLQDFAMASGWHRAIIFLLPFVLFVASADGNDLLVTIKNGIVQGKLLPVLNGSVGAFLGIPYAKPPVGKLRFRNPEPVDSWEGVKNASSFSNTCFQLADTTFPGGINVSSTFSAGLFYLCHFFRLQKTSKYVRVL